jgi:5-methylcytosine-specific restriction protein B
MRPAREVKSREAVLAAIDEYDALGQGAFLDKYGFAPSREYVLTYNGRNYDSKAILGAAYGYQYPERAPLRPHEFSGGAETRAPLEAMGFTVSLVEREDAMSDELAISLREGLEAVLTGYGRARLEPFGSSAHVWSHFERLADGFGQSEPVRVRNTLRVSWSAGRGNWARVPWIAFLDVRETGTTQHGVYPVLLFRQDMTGVYLTLAQGVTEPKQQGRAHAVNFLGEVAQRVRHSSPDLAAAGFALDSRIDLRADPGLGRDYELSTIAYKLYPRGEVPSDESILRDLESVCSAYDRYIEEGGSTSMQQPAADASAFLVYVSQAGRTNLHVGLEQGTWGFHEQPAHLPELQVGDLVGLAAGFDGDSPRASLEIWQAGTLATLEVGRVTRAAYSDETPLWPDEVAGDRAYPHRFGFERLGTERGVALGAGVELAAEAVDAIRRSSMNGGHGLRVSVLGSPLLERYAGGAKPDENLPPLAAVIADFSGKVTASGLILPERRAAAFVASLMAKPFAIMTGLSGSGKTQLALRLGDWFGASPAGERFLPVAVRPDWTGPEALLGYEDALSPRAQDGRPAWHVPDALAFMLRAAGDPDAPYLILLDEMNLAHVERYFSDFLSGAESHEAVLPNLARTSLDPAWRVVADGPPTIPIPRNLFVVGTVNVDETTYLFSSKVLDRAFVFEFRVGAQDLNPDATRPRDILPASAEALRALLRVARDDNWHIEHAHPARDELVARLVGAHERLSRSGHEFGHRVLLESLRFAAVLAEAGFEDADEALDLIAMQKLLPRLHGSRRRLHPVLTQLVAWAVDPDADGARTATPTSGDLAVRLPVTHSKLTRMLEALEANQFVSFAE